MPRFFWFTYAVLWALVVALLVMVLLLYRQFGLMFIPGRRRVELGGLDIGAQAPRLAVDLMRSSGPLVLTWDAPERGPPTSGWIAIFASPHCPICRRLWTEGELEGVAAEWPSVEFVWIDSEVPAEGEPPAGWTAAVSPDESANTLMDVPVFPFAYAIVPGGTLRAKGLVNEAADLKRIAELAFPSSAADVEDRGERALA